MKRQRNMSLQKILMICMFYHVHVSPMHSCFQIKHVEEEWKEVKNSRIGSKSFYPLEVNSSSSEKGNLSKLLINRRKRKCLRCSWWSIQIIWLPRWVSCKSHNVMWVSGCDSGPRGLGRISGPQTQVMWPAEGGLPAVTHIGKRKDWGEGVLSSSSSPRPCCSHEDLKKYENANNIC